ncbi:nitroreductase family protein [Desulfurivibrio dismutans]|uniref:nitroreductase family protein n=1 Tax=Desulfurivibrio dismutans TaxID=1398908 RepID=UPI0023DAF307|nr:nitroreductase family protein [Desulfurivibrio alkaliphilus]MDF1615139.1 nitroreductase family protein [Desulfurivibrio alkaliphilus]
MVQFQVDEQRCIQCGECALDCPAGVIAMDDDNRPQMRDSNGCIQCQHCLAICPTAAVSILGKDPEASLPLAGKMPSGEQLTALVKGRRTVRRYQEADLAPEQIDELLNIASHAPTGVNANAVLFTVVKKRAVLNKLRDDLVAKLGKLKEDGRLPEGPAGEYMSAVVNAWQEKGQDVLFRGAPHLLITSTPAGVPCPEQDCLIALTTFDLVAQAHGVGTVWDGIFMWALAACPEIRGQMGIPAEHRIGYAMAFGAPAVEYHRCVQRGPAQVNEVQR